MRSPLSPVPILLLAACGGEASAVAGDLAEDAEATHVWVLGEPARSAVAADSFRLEGVGDGILDLRFSDGDREVARMEIRGVGEGESLRLRGVWFDDGVAHPSALESDGGGVLTVNGIRMASAERVPGSVDATATVLAVSDEGDALIVRPADEGVPDLRVVVTPGTRVATPDGDPVSAEGLQFGDSVRVVGRSEAGYVVATELVVPRERAGDDPDRGRGKGRGRGRGRG